MLDDIVEIYGRRANKNCAFCGFVDRAPVAQLVDHWVVMWEVVSSAPTGPTLIFQLQFL